MLLVMMMVPSCAADFEQPVEQKHAMVWPITNSRKEGTTGSIGKGDVASCYQSVCVRIAG